jgi:cytidylate kinase
MVSAMTSRPVIAIDGNAASGKGALARSLAKKLAPLRVPWRVLHSAS